MAKTANQLQREWRQRHPRKARNNDLKKKYGITLEQYEQMLADQGGVCAICGNPEPVWDKKVNRLRALSVDHCHTTGKVRGLLCTGCNQGLGNFKENPDRLAKAISYLLGA